MAMNPIKSMCSSTGGPIFLDYIIKSLELLISRPLDKENEDSGYKTALE